MKNYYHMIFIKIFLLIFNGYKIINEIILILYNGN